MRPRGLNRGSVVRLDIDGVRTHGWQARLCPRKTRYTTGGSIRYRSKLFSDRAHGGRAEARRRALRWIRTQARKGV